MNRMSFVNIGTDGPPNHTLEIEGDMFVANVEDGTYTPVETETKLRFRTKPPGADSGYYRVTDIQLNSNLFGINASGSLTDFCIDSTGNVGIGTTPTKKLDVGGSMYISGTLTNESNVITNSSTVNGTITSTRLAWGPTSNIYGLLPTGAILMTTLTAAPSGWTDVTNSLSFTDRNVVIQDNATLTVSGNDDVTLSSYINHNHATVSHTSTHKHNNTPTATLYANDNHNHNYTAMSGQTSELGSHSHEFKDRVVNNNVKWGVNQGYDSNTVDRLIMGNYADFPKNTGSSGNHGHNCSPLNSNASKYGTNGHKHNISLAVGVSSNKGGAHGHTLGNQGSATAFSIVPPYYNLRFIQKN